MTTQRIPTARLPTPEVPEWWLARGGSEPEYFIYRAILRTGRVEGVDFIYQQKFAGGRITRGGVIADFVLNNPRMGINVQSIYFHNRTASQRAHDRLQREMLEARGLRMEYITEEQARSNADVFTRRAIAGTLNQGPTGN